MQRLIAEAYRLHLLRGLEGLLRADGFRRIAGVDEVGRGCLAGPVVAAAVIPDPASRIPGVDDSKKLGPADRRTIAALVRRSALATSVAIVSAEVIDGINILQATRRAMVKAVEGLSPPADCVLVDAVPLDGLAVPVLPVIRGDAMSYAIACASIVAKVARDDLMERYHEAFPYYRFDRNKGYGAPEHRAALGRFGPTPIHRLTFRSVVPRADIGGAPS